jgi:hypothetical protein
VITDTAVDPHRRTGYDPPIITSESGRSYGSPRLAPGLVAVEPHGGSPRVDGRRDGRTTVPHTHPGRKLDMAFKIIIMAQTTDQTLPIG